MKIVINARVPVNVQTLVQCQRDIYMKNSKQIVLRSTVSLKSTCEQFQFHKFSRVFWKSYL